MDRYLKAPLDREEVKTLRAGDYVYITGTIYTARDAAHLRMSQALDRGEKLPIELEGNVIYYMGPTPAREGRPIGSAGPTTASRMDKYTPRLLDLGLTGMIGKGKRKPEVTEAIVRNGAVFFAAVGGAGALLSKCIKKAEVIAYEDLGTEAIRRLEVENLPVIVVIDSQGNNLYEEVLKHQQKTKALNQRILKEPVKNSFFFEAVFLQPETSPLCRAEDYGILKVRKNEQEVL